VWLQIFTPECDFDIFESFNFSPENDEKIHFLIASWFHHVFNLRDDIAS